MRDSPALYPTVGVRVGGGLVGVGNKVGIYVGVCARGWNGVGDGSPLSGSVKIKGPPESPFIGSRDTWFGIVQAAANNKRILNERLRILFINNLVCFLL